MQQIREQFLFVNPPPYGGTHVGRDFFSVTTTHDGMVHTYHTTNVNCADHIVCVCVQW